MASLTDELLHSTAAILMNTTASPNIRIDASSAPALHLVDSVKHHALGLEWCPAQTLGVGHEADDAKQHHAGLDAHQAHLVLVGVAAGTQTRWKAIRVSHGS